jgi:hypothetical protein
LPNALVVTRFLCQLQLQAKRIARAAQGFASSFVFASLKLIHPRSKVRVAHVGQRLRVGRAYVVWAWVWTCSMRCET